MKTEQFCYWLQGFVELNGSLPTETQWTIIKDHLKLVMDKQTPDRMNETKTPYIPGIPRPFSEIKQDLKQITLC